MRVLHLTRKTATLALVGALAVAAAGYALRPSAIDVDTGAVATAPMRVTVDADGRARVRDRFVITAPVAGRLERILLREGALVAGGQIVARLAPLPLDSAAQRQAEARLRSAQGLEDETALRVGQARTAAEQAHRALARSDALLAAGAISSAAHEASAADARTRDEELSATQARVRAAAAEVDAARSVLLSARGEGPSVPVRSPAAGRVLRVPEPSERVIAAGMPLLEIGDASALEVIVDVLSSDAVQIRPGAAVDVDAWGGDAPMQGRVRGIEPSAFTHVSALGVDEQRVNVLVDLLDAPSTLGDGFRVEVRMTVWECASALVVPASAVFQRRGVWGVFVVNDGRARWRPIEIGHRTGASVEVVRGLPAGADVVLFPSDRVDDGVRVRTAGG